MKSRITVYVASAVLALGFASTAQSHELPPIDQPHVYHGHSGEWKSGGWVQWHPMPGFTQLGNIGTQRFQVREEENTVRLYPYTHTHSGYFGPGTVYEAGIHGFNGPAGATMCGCATGACACGQGHSR